MTEQTSDITTNITAGRLRKQSFGFWLAIFFALLVLAQVVRALVLSLGFPTFMNDKFAFSLDVPMPLMYLLYFAAVAFIVHHLVAHWRKMFLISKLGFLLIIAGGFSNFSERVIAGYVVDYVYLGNGVLNIADFYIMLGIVLIFVKRGYQAD